MKTSNKTLALDRLLEPLGQCLTEESARRVIRLKAEYARYVSFSTFMSILKSKARQVLANGRGGSDTSAGKDRALSAELVAGA